MKDQVKKWLDVNYQNYLKKNKPLEQSILDHILDWMNSKEAEPYLARLDRISVPASIDHSEKWTVLINKRNEKILKKQTQVLDESIKTVFEFENGYSIVKLNKERAFLEEGVKMGHCVGSYFEKYLSGDLEIFSLRDNDNEPHCTIEYNPKKRKLSQVKGKANLEVVKKYHKYIIQFLNQLNFEKAYAYDLKNIGSIYFGSYLFDVDAMPEKLTINKSLYIEQVNYLHVFDELIINGDATFIKNRRCHKLAKKLIVKGDLMIREFHGLLKIADEIQVDGYIEVVNCERLRLIANKYSCEESFIEDCESFNFDKLKVS